jgi:hypothetical protein
MKFTDIFHCETLPNLPKLRFWSINLATLCSRTPSFGSSSLDVTIVSGKLLSEAKIGKKYFCFEKGYFCEVVQMCKKIFGW